MVIRQNGLRRKFLLAFAFVPPEEDVEKKKPLRKRRSLITGATRDSTLKSYKYDLTPWINFCEAHALSMVCMIKTRDVEDHLLEQKTEGKAIASRRNRGIILQQLLNFAHQRKYIASECLSAQSAGGADYLRGDQAALVRGT